MAMIPDDEAVLEDALALRSRDGDPAALAALYRRVAPALLEALERALRDRAEAEDVLHEAFLRLFRGRGRYDGRGRFRGWIRTVAFRLATDRLRRRQRWRGLAERAAEVAAPAAPPDPARLAGDRDLLARVEGALADLPEAWAVTFHLRVREEMSYREISALLDEPEGTLRSRVHHALVRIRRAVAPAAAGHDVEAGGRDRASRTPYPRGGTR